MTTPEDYMGGIIGDINSRRGQISNMDDKNNLKVLTAFVPLATMFSYIAELRSLSKDSLLTHSRCVVTRAILLHVQCCVIVSR